MSVTSIDTELRKLHDQCVSEGAKHEVATCVICHPELAREEIIVSDEAALKERDDEISRLTAQIEDLTQKATEADIEERIEAARSEVQTQLDDLQAQYDQAVAETGAAKKQYDDLVAMIETEAAAQRDAAALEQAKAGRVAKVEPFKEILPENYITDNAERWAAMSEEAFDAMLEGWKTVAGDRAPVTDRIPESTAMVATADGWRRPVSGGRSRAREDSHALLAARYERGIDTRRV